MGIVRDFVAGEQASPVDLHLPGEEHAILDLFTYGPHGLMRVMFEMAEVFAVLRALRDDHEVAPRARRRPHLPRH